MDRTYPPEAWKRLGDELEKRRGRLGYGYRRRKDFLAARGGPPPSEKMLARLERGEQAAYPPATVELLEAMYDCPPGSFGEFLEGGDPAVLDKPRPVAVLPFPPLHAPGDVLGEAVTLLLDQVIDLLEHIPLPAEYSLAPDWYKFLRTILELKQDDKADLLLLALRSRLPAAESLAPRGERRGGSAS